MFKAKQTKFYASQVMSSGDLSVRARAFSVSSLIGSTQHSDDESSPNTDATKLQSFACSPTNKIDGEPTSIQNAAADLLCRELWLEFHALGTEMIITKAGR